MESDLEAELHAHGFAVGTHDSDSSVSRWAHAHSGPLDYSHNGDSRWGL